MQADLDAVLPLLAMLISDFETRDKEPSTVTKPLNIILQTEVEPRQPYLTIRVHEETGFIFSSVMSLIGAKDVQQMESTAKRLRNSLEKVYALAVRAEGKQ
jgi:hypothetical protein